MANSRALKSVRSKRFWRMLKMFSVALVLMVVVGAVGFYFFQGWRARDLAFKARENLERTNYRMAWLQLNSARSLRPNDPEVLRSSALIESAFGTPSALDYWDKLAERTRLSASDLTERARAAARMGNDEQFARAVRDLEASGEMAAAGRLRTVRNLARGNFGDAIEEARSTISATDDPGMKLDLARLLLRRYVEQLNQTPRNEESQRVMREMLALVNSLQGTPSAAEALAFGLTFLLPGRVEQERWAGLAMENMTAGNPAILPAATVMIDLGKAKPGDLYRELRPVFDAAPLDRRAAFSLWLSKQNMPAEALTLTTAQESGESTDAFVARTEALAKLGNWNGVIETADGGGYAPAWLRHITKARGEYQLGRGAQSGAKSVGDAMQAASREGTLAKVVVMADEIGAGDAVDSELVALCGDPGVAAQAFKLARDRFSRRGPSAWPLLASAHQRALDVSPQAVPVQDYARYVKLLQPMPAKRKSAEGGDEDKPGIIYPDPKETAPAVEKEPSDPIVRTTHSLALLRAGRPAEALAAFDDLDVFYDRMPPGTQAVICAVLAANGKDKEVTAMARVIDRDRLTKDERVLVEKIR